MPDITSISLKTYGPIVPSKPPSIYFGGCSFGSAFYVGVHRAFTEMWGEDYYEYTLISGGSAGTVMAVGIALGKSPEYLDQLYKTVAEKCRNLSPIYNASAFLEEEIKRMIMDDPLSYKKIEGRCCFGTTAFFSKHRWHVSWENNEDLIQTIICSFHIPFYCKNIQPVHGQLLLDGAYGFAGVDLIHDDETLFVGIDPHAEITRSFTFNEMFYPSVDIEHRRIVDSGYMAAKNWNGYKYHKVGFRQPNYPALVILWSLMYLEYALFSTIDILHFLISITWTIWNRIRRFLSMTL